MARTAVKAGWKALEKVLNEILSQTGSYRPLEGSGIRIEDVAGGTLISVSPDSTSNMDSSQNQTGTAGVPVTIQAFDINNNPVTITVMTNGAGVSASTLGWQSVAVVDPATCAQSAITVLEKPSS